MNKKIFSIRIKILLIISITIFAIGLITSFFVFNQTSDLLIKNKQNLISNLTVQQEHEISIFFGQSQQFVKMIATNNMVRDYLLKPNFNKEEMVKIFDSYQSDNPQYLAVYLLNKSGDAIISSDRKFLGKNYSFREYFKEAIIGNPNTSSLLGVTSNQFGYYFSYPVRSSDKKNVLGVVVAKLNNREVEKILIKSELSKSGIIMLVDKMGIIMYSEKKSLFLKSISQLTNSELELIKKENRFGKNLIKPLGYVAVKNRINTQVDGLYYTKFFDKEDNEEELIYSIKISNTPFYLIAEVNYEDVIKNTFLVTSIIATGVLFSAIIALIFISILIIKILYPLNKISTFIDKINKDNFHERLIIDTKDEFNQLAQILNKMLTNIEDSYKNIEKKVEEKTYELNKKIVEIEKSKIAILNVLEDVESEKKISEKLATDLQKFQQAVENASDHIVITDPEGIILYANHAVKVVTGFDNKKIIGQKAGSSHLWGGLMPKKVYKKFWKTIKDEKKIFVGEFNNKKANGENYIAEAHVSPILDSNNQVKFFIGIERDVTKAKEIDRMKTEFISLASHQLRTPLSAMKWFTEMLLAGDMGKLNKEQNEAVSNIEQSNERMIDLVNSLLNISRIESGRIIIDPKPTDLGVLIKDVVKSLENKIVEKKIIISISIHPNLPKINLDEKLIREVYVNLLTNAIKYTPEKGEVNIFISKKGEQIISQIQDSGYGIPLSQQSKIFSKFFRADNAVKHETDGNGLGLYLIKSIIESSNGKIWFKSEENKGSTFWFSLPISGMIAKEGQVRIT